MRLMLTSLLLIAALGCGSDGDPSAPEEVELPAGSMSARIDGASWSASTGLTATWGNGIFAVAGVDAAFTSLGFAVVAGGPGTFTIGPSQPTNAILSTAAGGASWHAVTTRGSGSITITALSATGASGTFTFNLVADGASGSTGTKTVTNGTFNVKF